MILVFIAEPLGDRETAQHCKRNTFSYKHGSGPRKNDNNRKQRTEEELNQLRKFALQRHCKKKCRTWKSVANCHEKAEVKIEQMMAVHAELKVYIAFTYCSQIQKFCCKDKHLLH